VRRSSPARTPDPNRGLAGRLLPAIGLAAWAAIGCAGACGNGNGSADDAFDGRVDDAGGDVRPDVDARPDAPDDAADEADAGDGGPEADVDDADDARDVPDYGECGRDVPFWEREIGEEWCYDPPVRDLRPFLSSPHPGCEQVSACRCGITMYDGYDVAGPFVSHFGPSEAVVRGTLLIDTRTWTEEVVEPWETRGGLPWLDDSGVVAYEMDRIGRVPDGTWVVRWDRTRGTKRVLYADPAAGDPIDRHAYYVRDFDRGLVLATFHETAYSEVNLRTIDIETLENLPVTRYEPMGQIIWGGRISGDVVMYTFGTRLYKTTLAERSPTLFAFGPGAQWDVAVHGDLACWLDLRDGYGDPGASYVGSEVWCADVTTETAWNASQALGYLKRAPDVHGDWVAWEQGLCPESAPSCPPPDGNTIMLYHVPSGRRWSLLDRAEGLRGTWTFRSPRLGEDHVYFLRSLPETRTLNEIYRCHIPTLFPEAYP
jgi:hypothetical protein